MKHLLTLSFILAAYLVYGQQKSASAKISLADIAKIDLTSNSSRDEKFELTQGNDGLWSCWQTVYSQYDNSRYAQRDDKPRLVKKVPVVMLRELLKYFNRPDTSRNIAWFDLKHDELVSELDSLKNTYFTSDQRKTFVNGLANRDSLTSSMNRILRNEYISRDGTQYKIELILKNGQKVLAEGTQGAYLYLLPWKIGAYPVYNPGIFRLFNSFIGKEKENQNIRRFYHHGIVFDMFLMSYRTGFHWSNFVTAFPEAVALAGPSIKPWRFISYGESYQGYFASVQLPENWIIGVGFNKPDSAMLSLRKVVQLLAGLYRDKKSVFDTLSVTPGGIALFRLVGNNYEGVYGDDKQKLESLSLSYSELKHTDWSTSVFVNVIPRGLPTRSEHLLLPEGKLILIHKN
jgi:hypothetical protein